MLNEVGTRNQYQIERHYYNSIAEHRHDFFWTDKDMRKFEEAYKLYGKNYVKIRDHLETKSLEQVYARTTTLVGLYKNNPKSVP